MEKKSEILENFKTAIGSTVKSLSNSENVEVSFGNQDFQSKNISIKLPEIEQINNKINYYILKKKKLISKMNFLNKTNEIIKIKRVMKSLRIHHKYVVKT